MFARGLSCLHRVAPLGIAVLLVGAPVRADRASLTLEQSLIGQTNVLRTPDDEESDVAYEVRPRLLFERPAGDLQYQLEYAPTYDYYFETEGISGFDQYGNALVSFSPTPTGTLTGRTNLAYYRTIRSDTATDPSGVPELVPDVAGRVFRGFGDVGYEHRITQTTTAKALVGLASYEYTSSNSADSIGGFGQLDVTHELTRTFAAGIFGAASHRRFDEVGTEPESNNTIYQVGPLMRFAPTPTLTIEGQAGPAWISIDQDAPDPRVVSRFRTTSAAGGTNAAVFNGCGAFAGRPLLSQCPLEFLGPFGTPLTTQSTTLAPPRPGSSDDDEVDGFARVLVRQQMFWGFASLEYVRGEEASSGSGATSIRDSLTGVVQLEAREVWSLRFRGNWNQRETRDRFDRVEVVAGPSASLSPFSGLPFAEAVGFVVVDRSRRKTTQYWADVRLRRQILASLSADAEVRYLNQDRTGDFGDSGDYEDWKGILTLRYELPALDY